MHTIKSNCKLSLLSYCSASKVLSENVSLASCETVDVPPPPCNVSASEVTDHNDVQNKTPVGSSPVDQKEDSAARIAEAGISIAVVSSEQGIDPCPVTGTEKQQSCDTSSQLLCETVDNCLKTVETPGTGKVSKPGKTLGDNQECTEEMDASPALHEPTAKQDEQLHPSLKISGDLEFNYSTFENFFHILHFVLWLICYLSLEKVICIIYQICKFL